MTRAVRLPLTQLAAGGRFELPDWPGMEVRRLAAPAAQAEGRVLYLVLAGELLVDLPDGRYLHLHRGDAADVDGPHALSPIEEAVVLAWKPLP
ncbi:MAG TPA: hypothetical protein ENK37_05550 [Oceanithermus profundus]|uniref:Cupin domain-containing protein n=1 Tax=Oceanithermus profundus TaxID=187137 RepID=A0A7C4VKK1_9DEIN|nr:hypothetical protein [Oceanithermus profundus]